MAKTIHTDKAPAAIGPYVQGKIVGNLFVCFWSSTIVTRNR